MEKVNILIVEDELETSRLIKNCLERVLECTIDAVDTGMAAINKIKEVDFDLVILDLKMPGLSGIDVLKEVKRYKALPDVLVVTAWDSAQVAHEVVQEGALDYVPKPIIPETFMMKIKSVLEKKGKYIEKQ